VADLDDDLQEIRRLLAEAYEHYFANGDGHCKSSEGAISLHWPPYFWREGEADSGPAVEIYSYVLGPSRSHYFKNSRAALAEVRKWHKAEMEFDYSEAEDA
jgi:hypothetical protein